MFKVVTSCVTESFLPLAIALSAKLVLAGTPHDVTFPACYRCLTRSHSCHCCPVHIMQLHIASCRHDTVAFGKCQHFVAGMRAIDLSCLLLAPAGFLMTYTSISTAILAIAAWNLMAWVPECCLLVCAQHASAVLRSVSWH